MKNYNMADAGKLGSVEQADIKTCFSDQCQTPTEQDANTAPHTEYPTLLAKHRLHLQRKCNLKMFDSGEWMLAKRGKAAPGDVLTPMDLNFIEDLPKAAYTTAFEFGKVQ